MSDRGQTPETNEPEANEIVVVGYSQRYAAAARELLVTEGGAKLVNDPADRGGTTRFGVSLRFLAAEGAFDEDGDGVADFDLDMDGDIDGQDIRMLTAGDAIYLFHRCFWKRIEAESFPKPLGEMLFDQAVNGGLRAARKLLQRAINSCLMEIPGARKGVALLTVDGVIGPATRACLQQVLLHPSLGLPAVVDMYRAAAKERYRDIAARLPSQKRFLEGWLNRADRLGVA